ncbi:MAG: DUF4129 domain-containing protein [Nocardioidaceae bacterium]|nr:DUF4129 domain-containing protein [Nocardioidaceae bacterium]
MHSSLLVVAAALRPDPPTARSWLDDELSRAEYRQGLLERFQGWLADVWDRLTQGALGAHPFSAAAAIGLTVLLVVVVALLVVRVRPETRYAAGSAPLLADASVSPEQHRAEAEAALAAGDADRALVEAFRALASRSVARGLLVERPGLTAHELAAELGPRFPELAEPLAASADRFDRVFYGRFTAAPDDARRVLELDEAVRRGRPATAVTR